MSTRIRIRDRISRLMVCAVLIPLLVLSGISVDVFVSHVHADGQLHTHARRTLITRDLDPQQVHHHTHAHAQMGHRCDSHRPHPHTAEPNSRHKHDGPADCDTETENESTLVVSSAGNLIRQNREADSQVLELLPAVLLVQVSSMEVVHCPAHRRISLNREVPSSVHLMRSTVLLI